MTATQQLQLQLLNLCTPQGFIYTYQARASGRGGGLAILCNEKYKVSSLPVTPHTPFESTTLKIHGTTPTTLAVIYCPPKHNSGFLNEFSNFVAILCSLSPNIILLGDFNIHMDNIDSSLTKEFTSCLDSFGIHQFINTPTHSRGHILDLICCTGVSPLKYTISDFPLLDHKLISFTVNLPLSKMKASRYIAFRNIKNIKPSTLSAAINSLPSTDHLTTPEDLVSHYNYGLNNLLDTLAPLKTRSVTFTRSAPWYTLELHGLKTEGRQLECLSRKTGLTIHNNMYHNHLLKYKDAIARPKCNTTPLSSGLLKETHALCSPHSTIYYGPLTLLPPTCTILPVAIISWTSSPAKLLIFINNYLPHARGITVNTAFFLLHLLYPLSLILISQPLLKYPPSFRNVSPPPVVSTLYLQILLNSISLLFSHSLPTS